MPRSLFVFLVCLLCSAAARAEAEQAIAPPSGVEVVSRHYPAPQGPLLLWFTGQYGEVEAERLVAAGLAAQGAEVWLTDWLVPYFLPQLPGSMAKVPDRDLGDWPAAPRT